MLKTAYNFVSSCCDHYFTDASCCDNNLNASANTDFCVICQENINVDEGIVTMGCSHKFHGQCLVNHLLQGDTRCPICRFSHEEDDEDEDDEPRPITLNDALIRAYADPALNQGPIATITKWKKNRKTAKNVIRATKSKLKPYKEEMQRVCKLFYEKKELELRTKFAHEYSTIKSAQKEITKCYHYGLNAKRRLAAKYGYVRVGRRGLRRC